MRYDPDTHHRRSIRLPGYDYARPGAYFVTICVQDHECLLGEIAGDETIPNGAGRMIEAWWRNFHRSSRLATPTPSSSCQTTFMASSSFAMTS